MTNEEIAALKAAEEQREAKEQEAFSDFYVLAFMPNPTRRNVKIWVRDVVTYMKREKFVALIESILGYRTSRIVDTYCTTYGLMYLIDKKNNTVTQIQPTAIENNRNFGKQAIDKFEKETRENKEASIDNSDYQKSVDGLTGEFIRKFSGIK